MKKIIFALTLLLSMQAIAQEKYLTKTGSIEFEASVPSFEEVAAKHNAVTALLNASNGEFATLVLVKGFRFKNALMEEHFNENYAESDQFPKATFKGILKDFSITNLNSISEYKINGELFFHGKTKAIEAVLVTITKKESIVTMTGTFTVKASDFDIKIPKIVRNKIAEEVVVNFNFELYKK